MSATGIGAAVRRKEDFRFITGKGQYTDDINRARARPTSTSSARRTRTRRSRRSTAQRRKGMPGVVAVLTGADLADDKIGNLICGWAITSKDGSPMKMSAHPAIANGKANHVGDAVAVVIAETLAQAKDAAEKVKVDYEVLPAVADPAKAQATGRAADPRRRAEQHDLPVAPRRHRARPKRRSRPPSTSPSSTSSTTGWCRTRWSRAPRSPTTMPAATS